jgi:glycine/D-amino acid oxidase-like deaminating enzyme/nitrite reductase/ring-hydroxylating ferredoxin subunit
MKDSNMKRDGAQLSIWQEGIAAYQPANQWNKGEIYDVLIVGGGISGLSAAILMQLEGKKCILAEAHNLGFGTTGGTTAHLNTMLDTSYDVIEKKFDADAAKLVAAGCREAIDTIESLVNKYNIDCDFEYKPGYMYAETDEEVELLNKIEAAAKRAGIAIGCSDTLPVPFSFKKACRFDLQAQFHITKYLSGLAKAFEQEGGVILQQCMVGKINSGEYHTAETTLGEIKAHNVMYATHIPPGINLLHFRCAPYRSYTAAFTLKSGSCPNALVYDLKDPYNYFRTASINGKQYIIGGGFDHKTGHNKNTEQVFRELEAYLRNHFDIGSIDYKWSSQYYISTDGLPYIGKLPGHDTIYAGTGYIGNGMILGTLSGKIICELISGKESAYAKLFDPSRIKPIAGFTEFVKENADVVSRFIGDRLSYNKIKSLVELAPGEATVTEWEGNTVAMYKEENGKLHILDAVCPHAKCIVAWNNAEKSWDCPCHGARYAPNGALLTGPATHGLTQIKWEDIEGD